MSINTDKNDGDYSLFSYYEIRDIVKGFTIAWLRGDIKINFPTAQSLLERSKFEGIKLSPKEASDKEVTYKFEFTSSLLVFSKGEFKTEKEYKERLLDIFNTIMSFKLGDRIEGKFIPYSREERILRLEEGLSKTNDLVKEMVDFMWGNKTEEI